MITYHCKFPVWQGLTAKLLQSYPTLCNPLDRSPPVSSVHGILQARIQDWAAISFSRGTSPPGGSNRNLLRLLHWQAVSANRLPWWLSGKESACQCRRPMLDPCVVGDPLEKNMATDSSILAWKIPRTEERRARAYGCKESDTNDCKQQRIC